MCPEGQGQRISTSWHRIDMLRFTDDIHNDWKRTRYKTNTKNNGQDNGRFTWAVTERVMVCSRNNNDTRIQLKDEIIEKILRY